MEDFHKKLFDLHKKSHLILKGFSDLDEKDIRKTHLEILASQITICLINFEVNVGFAKNHPDELSKHFNFDESAKENYLYNLIQNLRENIIEAALFQSELIFRFYYSKITGITTKEKNINKIFATLFSDVENNWQKEECKLLVLMWTLRNTIHTGGIYSDKPTYQLTYKGQQYNFESWKAPEFLNGNVSLELVSDLLDSLKVLFDSQTITDLGYIEHPNYFALNK